MRLPLFAIAVASLLGAGAARAAQPASVPAIPKPPVHALPTGACPALPKPRAGPPPFPAGESLSYDVDVLGAKAGQLVFDVLPTARGATEIPIRVKAESNTFFTKMKKITGEVTSTLRAKDLHPVRFHEDLLEGTTTRVADVVFKDRQAEVTWRSNQPKNPQGTNRFDFVGDALDYVGGIYLFRAAPLKVGQTVCFQVYAIKRMWRVDGKVEAREHVSVPAGEFEAFHLSGMAVSSSGNRREVHFWISDDAQRLPIAALGVMELGPVRAQLTEVRRPDLRTAAAKTSMEW